METRTLQIDGMSCGHCIGRVTNALGALPGVKVEDVKVGSARISFDRVQTPLRRIAEAIDEAGFTLKSAGAWS
jgi:copper chaperone